MARVISIEEHWVSDGIDRALRASGHDPSIVWNDRGDIPQRLADLDELRIAAMDEAGVDLQVVSIAPPGTNGMPAAEAIALCRDANDQATAAVARHPTRLRTMTTLPLADPDAAVAELERVAGEAAHVGVMAYGRCGDRPLDDPAFDEVLGAAARLGRPVFLHPQIPPDAVRSASYSGLGDDTLDLALATFGWGWHMEAGLAALRLILRGTFDRHPDLQLVLGHWGEMLLFALDRADSLSGIAGLERRVSEYVATNVHIATSGTLFERLLRHALDFTTVDRILLSGDYPFHRLAADDITAFLATLPDPADREKVAGANAAALYGLDAAAR